MVAGLAAMAAGLVCGCINDPVEYGDYNFLSAELELVWKTFDEAYVGFGPSDADWDQCYATAAARMDTVASYPGLGRVIWQMVEPLGDPGTAVQGYETGWSDYPSRDGVAPNVDSTLYFQYMDELGFQLIEPSWGLCMLADSTVPLFVVTGWTNFSWGTFDEYFDPLQGSAGMVIDLRLAPNRPYSYMTTMPKLVANRFADEQRTAYFRSRRNGPGREDLSTPNPCNLFPRNGFTGPTLVLTGPQNCMLTERFVSMMGCLPHVTLAGDTTRGIADATTLYAVGQGEVAVPDTAILAWDTTRIQRAGIAPETLVQADSGDFASGTDPVLEYAIEWAEGL